MGSNEGKVTEYIYSGAAQFVILEYFNTLLCYHYFCTTEGSIVHFTPVHLSDSISYFADLNFTVKTHKFNSNSLFVCLSLFFPLCHVYQLTEDKVVKGGCTCWLRPHAVSSGGVQTSRFVHQADDSKVHAELELSVLKLLLPPRLQRRVS